MVMPGGLSGADLALQARAMLPGVRVLFTSGYSQDVVADGGCLARGDQLLAKPYDLQGLARALRSLLDGEA